MRKLLVLILSVGLVPVLRAQEPVVAASDIDALFRSPDPKLQANKMVVYGIYRDLLQAGHWELAEQVPDRALHPAQSQCGVGPRRRGEVFTEGPEGQADADPARLTQPHRGGACGGRHGDGAIRGGAKRQRGQGVYNDVVRYMAH